MTKEQKSCEYEKKPGFRWHIHDCPNMRSKDNDRDMDRDHYECKVCGRTDWIDLDECR